MRNSERRKALYNVKMGGVPTWIFLLSATSLLTQYASASEPRVVCYYTNWSVYRPGTARFNPQNINPYLCTHLIYAFGGFTKDNTLKPFDKYQDIEKGGYAKFTGLKTYNNRLKTMLAIGGWNEGSSRFSPMVASRERRKEFVRNAIKFLRQNRFDGLDLDWEYPAFRDGGKPKDRDNYARLVRELREEFEREASKTGKPRLLLTMAVPAGIEYIQKGFDVKALNEHLDWMNLLSYDYHSAFEPAVNHHAPLYPLEEPNEYSVDNELNIDYTIQYYLENGADADKLVLGIPTYGRSYTLFNPDATELGAPADGPGEQGDATREKGYLAYYEICESLLEKPKKKKSIKADDEDDSEEEDEPEEEDLPWTVVQPNPSAMGPVAYRGNQWVGYDDIDIVKKKAEYVAEKRLGGIMFWSIDNDDFRGKCHGKPYPLIEAAKEAYISKLGITDNAITSERQPSSSRRRSRPSSTAAPAGTRRAAAASSTPVWSNTTPEPPTTPDPGSDFKCTDEGFYPHPRDCKKYFWCLDSGPSNLGIVAHQFTCPSGLFFNKLADSCDFARNVLCKKTAEVNSTTTAKPATSTNQPRTSTTSRPAATTTTRRPNKITSKSSVYFRTTTTTIRPVVDDDEVYEDEIIEDAEAAEVDSEDPKVIKELIDLIKKAGGVEQLERHLKLSGGDAPPAAGTTTPLPIPKKLYQKVLDHARQAGKSNLLDRYNSVSRDTSGQSGKRSEGSKSGQNSRRGPQNEGIESAPEASSLRRERPQYTTINRGRPAATSEEASEREVTEETALRAEPEAQEQAPAARAAPPPAPHKQYVNIRRARPTTQAPDQDDDAARNALFERNEATFVSTASEYPPSQSSRHHTPEYVTIRRSRPTTEEPTTAKYQTIERERPVYEEAEEDEEPPAPATPQYSTLHRTRGTTSSEPLTSPAPTTVLAVQISSLLNSPVTTEPQPSIQTTEHGASDLDPSSSPTAETELPTTVTEPTTTMTLTPSSTANSRRAILKRVRSTTTTTTSSPTSAAPQVSSERNYNIIRRRRPNEISSDLEEPEGSLRKIRSTTPDSRETPGNVQSNGELGLVSRGSRNRFNRTIGNSVDSVSSAARTPLNRGRFRPILNRDELSSLTPIDHEISDTILLERNAPQPERKFRPRNRPVTASNTAPDTEASAATVEVRRPDFIPRGRSRFTVTSSTETPPSLVDVSTESPKQERKPTFSRFTPRPFSRFGSSTASQSEISVSEDVSIASERDNSSATPRSPVRLPFGRTRAPPSNPRNGVLQARIVSPLFRRGSSTTESLVEAKIEDIEDETENKTDDIHLSESTIEEKEHEDNISEEQQEVKRRRIVIKKNITNPVSSEIEEYFDNVTDIVSTSENDINTISVTPGSNLKILGDDEGRQKRIKIIRRRPTSTPTSVIIDSVTEISSAQNVSSAPNRIRKIIRKKIIPYLAKPVTELDKKIEVDNHEITEKIPVESNYGEKASPVVFSVKSAIQEPENISLSLKLEDSTNQDLVEEVTTVKIINISQSDQDLSQVSIVPDTTIKIPAKDIEIVDPQDVTESTNVVESTEPVSKSTEVISSTSAKSKFERAQYRPPKRLFTPSTEASVAPSSRTYSRKYNGATYTSPIIPDREVSERSRAAVVTRRPLFTSKPFSRKPFTPRTTKKVEKDYKDEEFEEESIEEDESPLVFVPENQLFSRGSNGNEDSINSQNKDEVEDDFVEEEEEIIKPSSRRPFFRPKTINSNTFRASTLTTEIPKRKFSSSQNRTTIYDKSIFSKPSSNDTKKRTQNVPVRYNAQTNNVESKEDIVNEETDLNQTWREDNIITTTFTSVENYETTRDDEYLTDKIIENFTDVDTTLNTRLENISTSNDENLSTVTEPMEVDTSTDEYLEFKEETQEPQGIDNPTTIAQHVFSETLQTNSGSQTTVSSETTYHDSINEQKDELETTTTTPETTSFIETHFDKLFSVRRVVEVSSKQDKHRINRNNESRLVETGEIMQEKKPTEDKIGEVSRFTLIKIVKDDIPIYLTKLGHVYPVDNPPDNPIRIDEGRNARALVNFTDAGRENLVASESVNEAYRHVNKLDTTKINMNISNPLLELLKRDNFEIHNNEEDKTEKSQSYSPYPIQWQFVPAAYENDYTKEKHNKQAKSFEVITPRSYKTDPSTIALEGLFKTENPLLLTARKVSQDVSQSTINNQPFLVYAAPRSIDQDPTNFVKLQVLQPEHGRSVKTYVRGQELSGVSDSTTVKYPVSISILSTNSGTDDNKGTAIPTDYITSTNKMEYFNTVTETTTIFSSDITTETDNKITTKVAETATEPEVTTPKLIVSSDSLADNAKKRPKLSFPRRPNFRNNNITRITISPLPNLVTTPRTTKNTNQTILTSNVKANKSSSFNPNKSRYSANRSQNVPVDARGSKKTSPSGFLQRQNSTDFVRVQAANSESSRKLYFKPIRPNLLRPSFVPRRASTSTEATTQTTTRRSFPRRRPTAAAVTRDPDASDEATTGPSTREVTAEATTSKTRVRGVSKFDKKRTPAVKVTGGKSDPPAESFRAKKRPSLLDETASQSTGAVRRPTRTYVRRRPGGGGANATSTATPDTTTTSTSKTPTDGTRRPFRVVGRRRTTASSTVAPATSTPATVAPAADAARATTATAEGAETSSHDLAVQESMEKESNDRPSEPKRPHKKTVKIQRRPLSSRQPPASAATTTTTTEEPKKREGKKYSASFKQNQLDEAIRQKSGEVDESTEPLEELSVDTAIAIAAHQLLGAPLPSTPTYDDETDYSPSKKPPSASTKAYRAPSTEAYTGYSNSKDYSGRGSYPTGFTTLNPTISSIQSSTPHSTGFSSSSPVYSRGSTASLIGSSLGYTRDSTIDSSNPTTYSKGSSAGLTSSSPSYTQVYSKGPTSSVPSPTPVYSRGSSTYVPSLNRYLGTTNKYVSIPIDDFGYSTDGYTGGIGQEPAYFTREYLMESPQTRKYETDYQYLTTETPIRVPKRPTAFRRISTTVGPSTRGILILPPVTPQPRRSPSKVKVYDKLPKNQVTYRPVLNYDYYDDGDEKLLDRYPEANKVVVHDNGNIECLDMGNFPHPASCRKFVSCARMESGALVGWEYVCPQGLSYDPVGGICNWSAGLGCNES